MTWLTVSQVKPSNCLCEYNSVVLFWSVVMQSAPFLWVSCYLASSDNQGVWIIGCQIIKVALYYTPLLNYYPACSWFHVKNHIKSSKSLLLAYFSYMLVLSISTKYPILVKTSSPVRLGWAIKTSSTIWQSDHSLSVTFYVWTITHHSSFLCRNIIETKRSTRFKIIRWWLFKHHIRSEGPTGTH